MKHFFKHLQIYIFRGFLASIPIFLCYMAISLLYVLIDKKVVVFLNNFIDVKLLPGLGILIVLIIMYLIGLIVSNYLGRKIFRLIEKLTERIPLIKSVYSIGKQLSQSLDVNNDKKGFKKAVLVRINDVLVPGFIAGTIIDETTSEELILVFFPTAPTPTQGFVTAIKKDKIIDPGWTVEEGFKIVVSAGIIAPKSIQKIS